MILKIIYSYFFVCVIFEVTTANEFYESLLPDNEKFNAQHINPHNILLKPTDDPSIQDLKSFLKNIRTGDNDDSIIINQDRMCEKRGQCKCGSGTLCNIQDIYEVAEDVDKIIDNINRQVRKKEDNYDALRCSTGRCGSDENLGNLKIKGISDDYIDNDLNIKDEIYDDDPNQNLLQTVISEIQHITDPDSKTKNSKLAQNVVYALTPEDIADYYRSAMDDLRRSLLGYIKYRTDFKRVRGLPKPVRGGIQTIREKYRHFKTSDKTLSKQIFDLLLGDMKKIKIVPNKDPQNTYDVFLPDWMYLEVLKKKEGRRLRSNKRVLPLTLHQKNRMQNKTGPRKLKKYTWRRSLDADQAKYGVPFVLDIQGLGQIN